MNTNEQLISVIEETGIAAYQDASILGLFEGIPIGDVGVTQWFHKSFNDIPDAALTLAGFNPQEAKLEAEMFSNKVVTASEKLVISQTAWAQYQKVGMDVEGIRMLAAKVGRTASYALWRGEDIEGDQPFLQYNYINEAGTGNGALNRPLINTSATSGAWSTFSNKAADLSSLESQLVSKGYNLASTIVFYPQIAHKPMTQRGSATNEISAKAYLETDGVMAVLPMPDSYMYTLAGDNPTAALFDLYAIDMSQIKIGYTMEETTNVIPPFGDVRSTAVESEVWFAPKITPRPWAADGKIYKGVSRITAIAP